MNLYIIKTNDKLSPDLEEYFVNKIVELGLTTSKQEHIDEMYRQYNTTKCKKTKKELYKAIKRAEGKRRKEKLDKEGIVV